MVIVVCTPCSGTRGCCAVRKSCTQSDGGRTGSRRRRYSSYCGSIGATPDNLLAGGFRIDTPNQKWPTDITESRIPAGKVCLSPVINCSDGKVMSGFLSTCPDTDLANTMPDSAINTLNAGVNPIIHSDSGGHYRWSGWLERVNAAGLIRSINPQRGLNR